MAYDVPGVTESPTRDEYRALQQATEDYFDSFLKDFFEAVPGVTFRGIHTSLRYTTDQPAAELIFYDAFNLYMEYRWAELIFSPNSDPIPTEEEALELLQMSITPAYILDVVRPSNSFFATTSQALLRPVECRADP